VSRRRRPLPLWAAVLINLTVGLVVVALVQTFLVKVGRIPSGSMEQTLQSERLGGDRILVNRLAYGGGPGPQPGDIVAVVRPDDWPGAPTHSGGWLSALARGFGDLSGIGPSNEDYIVKRVVARGGQTVGCCDAGGHLIRDGSPVDEPYVFEDLPFGSGTLDCGTVPRSPRCFPETRVPDGQLVLLGDHRSDSEDSAADCRFATPAEGCVRTVPESAVVGKVVFRIWPLDRLGVPD
jgi:signal peptidase I